MVQEIPFDKVIKDHGSWCDDMNVDIMMENHEKLRPIIGKMFFTNWPKTPKAFALLFSKPNFADTLINSMLELGIRGGLNKVWFTEYSEEDKQKLIDIGIIEPCENASIVFTKSDNDCFVSVFI